MKSGRLFISYSHKNRRWLELFHTHLKPYVRRGLSIWDDTQISAGSRWKVEIDSMLSECRAALLLVSPDFLGSDFIHDWELGPLLAAEKEIGLPILWSHISSCAYKQTPIANLQALHDPAFPLDSMPVSKRAAALTKICYELNNLLQGGYSSSSPQQQPQQQAQSITTPAKEFSNNQVRYVLILGGSNFEDSHPSSALFSEIHRTANDPGLTVLSIERGSIKLTLRGSAEGFDNLQSAVVNGLLQERTSRNILSMYMIDGTSALAERAS